MLAVACTEGTVTKLGKLDTPCKLLVVLVVLEPLRFIVNKVEGHAVEVLTSMVLLFESTRTITYSVKLKAACAVAKRRQVAKYVLMVDER